jgi:RND family efflux transporter MFP subunit
VIGFSLSTRINEILVRGGQDVAKDQLMVRGDDVEDQAFLDLQEMRANSEVPVLAAKAAMDLSVLELERITKVFQNGGSNQQEFDRAKLTSDRARLDFEAAKESQAQERVGLKARKARVEKLLLRAPFDGQIDSIQGDVGQSVSEQDKVVRVVNVDSLWIDTPAPMSEVETLSLKVGDPAWVLMGAAGVPRIVQGKVIEVAPTTDLSSRSRRIRVELANPKGEGRLIAGDESWTRFKVPTELVIAQVKAAGGTITTSVTAAPDSGVRPE